MDRAAIPAVWCLGKLRRRRHLDLTAPKHIGALANAALGDTTLLGPGLQDLRQAFPRARLTLFAGASNVAVARLLGVADQVVDLPILHPWLACRTLRRAALDVLVDFGQWPRISALLAHFSSARYKVGFRTPGQYRHYVYDRWVDHSSEQHELENFRDLVRALGVPTTHQPAFPATVGRACRLRGEIRAAPYVALHLWPSGYRSHLKEWPIGNWLELGRKLAATGLRVVLTGAPSDRDRNGVVIALAAKQERGGSAWINGAGCALEETLAILRGARLTVSVNTGVMHLAAALDVPVIGLHGPTSARRWGPIGRRAVAVSAPGADCGYLNLGFEYPARCDCMSRIAVDRVLDHCRAILDERPTGLPERSATMSVN